MNLHFMGAAQEVTGSCYLMETKGLRFLVDCGMVQGGREAPARNRQPFGFDAKKIDFVLLTHAHIDHSGLLPKLTRAGFKGPIYTTSATADLLGVMLPDSAHIQEADAERAKRRSRRGKTTAASAPIYTMQDTRECLRQVQAVGYDDKHDPHPAVRCRFRDAGHILGSAIIEVWITESDIFWAPPLSRSGSLKAVRPQRSCSAGIWASQGDQSCAIRPSSRRPTFC